MATIKELTDYYKRPDKSPVAFARMVEEVIKAGSRINRVSSETGISVGAISKYRRLLLLPPYVQREVESRAIPFRVAREFAGSMLLSRPDFDALLDLFTSKTLKAQKINAFMVAVRKHPRLSARQYRDIVLSGKEVQPKPKPVVEKPRHARPTPHEVQQAALNLIATLMLWEPDSTVDTLLAVSALKKLKSLIEKAAE